MFGSADYLIANGSDDVAAHNWVGVAAPLTRSPVGAWLQDRLAEPPAIRADSFLTMARLVASGAGLAMLPTFVGRAEPGLLEHPRIGDREETDIWVATHPDLIFLPQVAELVTFFANAIGGGANLMS